MDRRYIDVDLSDSSIVMKEVDINEMEQGHKIYEVADSLIRLKSESGDRYKGRFYFGEEEKEISVSKMSEFAYVDNEPVNIARLIEMVTGEKEEDVLIRLFDLKRDDYVWYVMYKNGVIAMKDSEGRWYTYVKQE